jgi:hypothetical protein
VGQFPLNSLDGKHNQIDCPVRISDSQLSVAWSGWVVMIEFLNDKVQKLLALFPPLDQLREKLLDKLTLDVLLLLFVVYLIERARRKMRRDLQYYLDTISQKLSALRDEVEAIPETISEDDKPPPPPTAQPPNEGIQYWEQIRTQWADVRDRIETKIDQLPASARRPYSQIRRGNYETIIARLRTVNQAISQDTTNRLLKMSGLYHVNRPTAKRTKKATAEQYQQLYDAVIKELPKPPDGDDA